MRGPEAQESARDAPDNAANPKARTVPASEPAEIDRVEGGKTVADVFAAGPKSAGMEVLLRAKVVKYTPGIMGRNWLHVRDGTCSAGTDDLVVTTEDTCKVGDVVVLRGKLVENRDFGYSHKFDVLIEDATVTVER